MRTKTARNILIARYKVCSLCGASDGLTVHHIRPRAIGGCTSLHNLVLVCRSCHDDIEHPVQCFFSDCTALVVWFRTILMLGLKVRRKRSSPDL